MSKTQPDRIVFKISNKQYQNYENWQKEVEERIAREQLETRVSYQGNELSRLDLDWIKENLAGGKPRPYYGAVGGAYVYEFCPTSAGLSVKVENTESGDEINLTDYEASQERVMFEIGGEDYQNLVKWQQGIEDRGDYIYRFCPTAVGLIIKVKNTETGDEIDLTEYDDW